ncbi:hypothetical protein [Verrucomicrobium spinosum]|uniref:hypothetical protein n=1 Tax=Verrucomicrobium spinosum TaxID=2736 RepID=UPI0009462D22|nr:hypothetical protein [Verrucomicrobium spinosum]
METTDTTVSNSDSLRRAAIDRSVKGPVLFLFANAALWLLASTIMGLIASVKLVKPGFLDYDWLWFLNYGRLQPAHLTALVYGWAIQSGLGASIWILARRSGLALERGAGSMVTAGVFWNIGVTLGVLGILFGGSTSLTWLEFPAFVWPLFLVAFLIIAGRMVLHYNAVQRENWFFLSSWYILAGLFCFPWIFATVNLLLNHYAPASPLGAIGLVSTPGM